MMNRTLLPLLLLCFSIGVYAQPAWTLKENSNWKFYQYGGLRFVNGIPQADTSSMSFYYNSGSTGIYSYSGASVSDAQGNLLFYTDAYNVWDKNDDPMPNGNNLLSSNAIDGTLILPVLNNPNQYYIFYLAGTIDFGGASNNAYQLRYSIVDMTLNNGLGDVVAGKKNVLVANNLSSHIKAVPGNDCNIWLITHAVDSAQFKAYEVTSSGVSTTPVISNAGNGKVGLMGPLSFIGHMNIAHDRKHLAFAQYGGDFIPILELYDFNPSTAIVSNPRVIDSLTFITYNLCFSPDDSKLYLTMNNSGVSDWHVASSLFQYNLNAGTATDIKNSKVLLSDSVSSVNVCMRIGPDGKIYLPASYGNDTSSGYDDYVYDLNKNPASYPNGAYPPFHAYLGCIQSPNALGQACNFNRHAVALAPYSSAAEALGGEFVKPTPGDTVYTHTDTTLCNVENVDLTLQPSFPSFYFEWDDGSSDSQRTVTAEGTYWVRNGDYCHYRVDTFVVKAESLDAHITINGFTLGTSVSYAGYQWLLNDNIIPGATNSTYTVTQNGAYKVIVTGAAGCKDTSDVYTVNNYTGIEDINTLARQINIFPNPTSNIIYIHAPIAVNVTLTDVTGKIIRQAQNVRKIPVKSLSAGLYLLRIMDTNGTLIKVEKVAKQNK